MPPPPAPPLKLKCSPGIPKTQHDASPPPSPPPAPTISVGVPPATKPRHDAAMHVVLALLSSFPLETSLRVAWSHPISLLSIPAHGTVQRNRYMICIR